MGFGGDRVVKAFLLSILPFMAQQRERRGVEYFVCAVEQR